MDQPDAHREQGFHDLLGRVTPEITARGGAIFGAALGNLIKQADPAFSVERYGANRLVDLLLGCPDVGRVERDSRGKDILFVLEGSDPATAPVPSNTPRLRHQLWNALVSVRPRHGAFLDLGAGRLVFARADELPPGVHEDPVRFLAIEAIDQKEMREWAVEFAGTHLDELGVKHVQALDLGVWFAEFTRALPARLRGPWQSVHAERVVAIWCDWAKKHDLDPEVGYTAPSRRPPPPRRQGSSTAPHESSRLERIRQLMHAAVDEMSEDELLELRIPLRYVIGRD